MFLVSLRVWCGGFFSLSIFWARGLSQNGGLPYSYRVTALYALTPWGVARTHAPTGAKPIKIGYPITHSATSFLVRLYVDVFVPRRTQIFGQRRTDPGGAAVRPPPATAPRLGTWQPGKGRQFLVCPVS